MLLEQWGQDLRLAAHGLARARAFTGAAILTLAVGIGGTTAMFALVEGVLLRPLPVGEQDRLVVVWKSLPTGAAHWPFRAAEIDLLRRESHILESVAGISYYDPSPVLVVENGAASTYRRRGHRRFLQRDRGRAASGPGPEPRGRRRGRRERARHHPPTVAKPLRRLARRDRPRVIVGERPFVDRGRDAAQRRVPARRAGLDDAGASASTMENPGHDAMLHDVDLIARLRPGATIEQARSELAGLTTQLDADSRAGRGERLGTSRPLLRGGGGGHGSSGPPTPVRRRRAGTAHRERQCRHSPAPAGRLGGPSWRCAPPSAPDPAGWLASCWPRACCWRSPRVRSASWPRGGRSALSGARSRRVAPRRRRAHRSDRGRRRRWPRVPHRRPGRHRARAFLGSRGPRLAAADRRTRRDRERPRRGRGALVMAQVALAVTIVAAAGLLTRSLMRLQAVDMGLATDHLVLVRLALPRGKYADGPVISSSSNRASVSSRPHLALKRRPPSILCPSPAPAAGILPCSRPKGRLRSGRRTTRRSTSSRSTRSYFKTLQVTLVRGRGFTAADGKTVLPGSRSSTTMSRSNLAG